jgi:hypothetical protein
MRAAKATRMTGRSNPVSRRTLVSEFEGRETRDIFPEAVWQGL